MDNATIVPSVDTAHGDNDAKWLPDSRRVVVHAKNRANTSPARPFPRARASPRVDLHRVICNIKFKLANRSHATTFLACPGCAPFDHTRRGSCRAVARQGARVHAGLRDLARHWHGSVRRAGDLHSHDHVAGARHQHEWADRTPGAPARSAPRQSRRMGARTVVLPGLSGVAGRQYWYGHYGVD